MATTKTTSTKPKWTTEKIADAYVKVLLITGQRPTSVFKFADDLGMSESDFYTFFSSFDALESAVWESFIDKTLSAIRNDSNYAAFSAREKLLAFYFTHLEILKAKRSFVVIKWPDFKQQATTPQWLRSYRRKFLEFARALVAEGIEKNEIKERPYLSERYDKAFWFQLGFVIDFWNKDSSKDFEKTDAAIEKAVNLSFQLLGESTLDSAIDFAKFIWQSR